jgi:hypothetical protein
MELSFAKGWHYYPDHQAKSLFPFRWQKQSQREIKSAVLQQEHNSSSSIHLKNQKFTAA